LQTEFSINKFGKKGLYFHISKNIWYETNRHFYQQQFSIFFKWIKILNPNFTI
jgi:hypothetical protein